MTKPRLIADSANDNSVDGDRLEDGTVSNSKLAGDATLSSNSVNFSPLGDDWDRNDGADGRTRI